MANLDIYRGLSENLNNVPIVDGNFIITKDDGKIYADIGNERIPLGGDDLPLEKGEGENSVQMPEGKAISTNSTALGLNAIVGCHAWYIKHIDQKTTSTDEATVIEGRIYLQNESYVNTALKPTMNASATLEEEITSSTYYLDIDLGYPNLMNQDICIKNNGYYTFRGAKITAIAGNCIVYTGSLGFNSINNDNDIGNQDYTLWIPALPINNGPYILGDSSVAEGRDTVSAHDFAHAEGWNSIVGGRFGHAEGNSTKAGASAHSEGQSTTASGENSHAEGIRTIASGEISHAEGADTQAIGSKSHAEGSLTIASGPHSHAEGTGAQAIGNASHASGSGTQAKGTFSYAIGNQSVAAGESSFAGGYKSQANNKNTFAMGYETKATGDASFATGIGNTSSGKGTSAFGWANTASNESSLANGSRNTASGKNSHAEGYYTKSTAEGSHSEGYSTLAGHSYSHAEGWETQTSNSYQHVEGKFNADETSAFLIVGCGTSDTARANCFTTGFDPSMNQSYIKIGSVQLYEQDLDDIIRFVRTNII